MPILFRCENCNHKLSVSSRKGGSQLKCPKCSAEVMVPVPQAKIIPEESPQRISKKESLLPPTRELETAPDKSANPGDERAWAPTRELKENPQAAFAPTAPLQPARPPAMGPPPRPEKRFPNPPAASGEEEEEFTLRGPRMEQDEMDLTPMVDVTFLLLIFFMITASFSLTKTIETPPPDPDKQGAKTLQNLDELEMTSIMARIDDQDNVFLDDEPVDVLDLETVLGDKLRSEQKNELIIQASTQCRHETFVQVFDAATGAGMQKIRLAASRGGE
jgi:biopolymer transport protein ExbD